MSKGVTVWLTGLSGAGKTTIARGVENLLWSRGVPVERLDGDEVRQWLSRDLGFSREERERNIERVTFVAKLLTRNGVIVLAALIAPYRSMREISRREICHFLEVYVRASLSTLLERDAKGLYRRAMAGEIPNFTGVNDPYEEPVAPDLVCDTDRETVEESCGKVLRLQEQRGYLRPTVKADVRVFEALNPGLSVPRGGALVDREASGEAVAEWLGQGASTLRVVPKAPSWLAMRSRRCGEPRQAGMSVTMRQTKGVRAWVARLARAALAEAEWRAIKRRNHSIQRRYRGVRDLRVAGFWNGHDASCCLFEDSRVVAHIELERYFRLKQVHGDALHVLWRYVLAPAGLGFDTVDIYVTCTPLATFERYASSHRPRNDRVFFVGHHTAHAAHAFYSSNLSEAMILTVDGGGIEGRTPGSIGMYLGNGHRIFPVRPFRLRPNIGGVWSRCTRYVFGLQTGGPGGHQAGTVMAMAALGDPSRFVDRFYRALSVDNVAAEARPPGHDWYRRDLFLPIDPDRDPPHPYWADLRRLALEDEQTRFDLAAGLQAATERVLAGLIEELRVATGQRVHNLCLAGGVALNAVVVGALARRLPWLDEIFVPPVSAADGLSLGAVQYLVHHVLGRPRHRYEPFFSPYLGVKYDSTAVMGALEGVAPQVEWRECATPEVAQILAGDRIVAVFHDRSESGRRALGHRSILASPINEKTKALVNKKVKHRQWFRPFAPSVLEEEAGDWFEEVWPSPYMSLVVPFRPSIRDRVPAVVHYDGSARLQTVSRRGSPWFYELITCFKEVTGVPILLNISFNDCEPIVESPADALQCFLDTSIDHLYFVDEKLLVSKRGAVR